MGAEMVLIMQSVRKAVITLTTAGTLVLAGSAAFSSSNSLSQAGLCLPPIASITLPGLTCATATIEPPTTTTQPALSVSGGASAGASTSAAAAGASGGADTPAALIMPSTTPSATQLSGTSGRSASPVAGALADPATSAVANPATSALADPVAAPLPAAPRARDALSAPQLASAQAAADTQVLAAGPAGGDVLAAGRSPLVTPSAHPLLRVLLALVAVAAAALAASQLPAAVRLMRAADQKR
jgi:hypothetical protein